VGVTSLSDRTNQVSVICHLSSSCRDKPNLPKFFSSNWKTSWLKTRANAFCWVPPSTHHAALPKQPTRFPAPRGHRLSSRFEPPALPMKFVFPPPYVISVALVSCRVLPHSAAFPPLCRLPSHTTREAGVWFATGDQSNADQVREQSRFPYVLVGVANVFKNTTLYACRHKERRTNSKYRDLGH